MRRNERIYEDDDGRTIADMSGIEPQPMLIPRIRKRRDRADFREPDAPAANDRPSDRRCFSHRRRAGHPCDAGTMVLTQRKEDSYESLPFCFAAQCAVNDKLHPFLRI